MKIHVLTVKQPWAHLIVHGYKSASGGIEHKLIENRTRRTAEDAPDQCGARPDHRAGSVEQLPISVLCETRS